MICVWIFGVAPLALARGAFSPWVTLPPVRPAGYEQIRIRMNVHADCSDEELDELLAYTQQHSPVCNTVCRPVPVSIERTRT